VCQRRTVPELGGHQDRFRQPGRRAGPDHLGRPGPQGPRRATTSFAEAGRYDGAPAFSADHVSMIVDGQWAVWEFTTAKSDFGVALLPAGTSGHSATKHRHRRRHRLQPQRHGRRGRHHVRAVAGAARAGHPPDGDERRPAERTGAAAAGRGQAGGGHPGDLPDLRHPASGCCSTWS
jgi:hypothetical protein